MNDSPVHTTPEIAHVLFVDIVGYSKESTTAQSRLIGELTGHVNGSKAYQDAKRKGRVMPLPTGDGMALLFFDDVFAPAHCAAEISKSLSGLRVRMGIHSGLVQRQTDIAGAENVVGEGINTAQRVMDAADEGHILLSAQYATWLRQFEQWTPHVHEVGTAKAKHGQELLVCNLYGDDFGNAITPSKVTPSTAVAREVGPGALKVVILYRRKTQPDDLVLSLIESSLGTLGHELFVDRHLKIGVDWAKAIEEKIRAADVVVAILSDAASGSEMLEYELETAFDENKKRGKPYLLPVRVGTDKVVEGPIGGYVNGLNFTVWHGPMDDQRVIAELVSAMTDPPKPKGEERQFEPVGGAVAPDSPFYVERAGDAEFSKALRASESILLVKGPRQVGKTSMIGRGTKLVRQLGWRFATTDFQKLSSSHLASEDAFYRLLAATIARQLNFSYDFSTEWLDVFGANMNMDNFVRSVIEASDSPLVWFMDEADKLFGISFASDFFGLVRSWHNSRATEPGGPWARFTVVIGYATEAHLFIQDLNQSPFNVGRQVPLSNFSLEQSADLNGRYGAPLSGDQVRQLWEIIGGQPFLTRRALDLLGRGAMDFPTLLASAARDEGPFGDHLKRILISVSQMPMVLEALRASITSPEFQESEGVHRLIAAGVAHQTAGNKVVLMCELYRQYLSTHLAA
ncbi:MAG: AAA-like domain-containing protein [Fimbriimonadaceae bacterium]